MKSPFKKDHPLAKAIETGQQSAAMRGYWAVIKAVADQIMPDPPPRIIPKLSKAVPPDALTADKIQKVAHAPEEAQTDAQVQRQADAI